MPHKYNADRRHHIARPKRRVTNWSAYNEALRQLGSLTVWFTDDAIAAWKAAPRTTPGGQPHYSDLAITTALTLRAVFRLALRQTEGLIGSIIGLLGLDLAIPDHSTLSRRAETLQVFPRPRSATEPVHLLVDSTGLRLCGPGEWLVEKHRARTRRSWRKLHLGVQDNLLGHFQIGGRIDEHVTVAGAGLNHRNFGRFDDVVDERRPAPRDDQIDLPPRRQEFGDERPVG